MSFGGPECGLQTRSCLAAEWLNSTFRAVFIVPLLMILLYQTSRRKITIISFNHLTSSCVFVLQPFQLISLGNFLSKFLWNFTIKVPHGDEPLLQDNLFFPPSFMTCLHQNQIIRPKALFCWS